MDPLYTIHQSGCLPYDKTLGVFGVLLPVGAIVQVIACGKKAFANNENLQEDASLKGRAKPATAWQHLGRAVILSIPIFGSLSLFLYDKYADVKRAERLVAAAWLDGVTHEESESLLREAGDLYKKLGKQSDCDRVRNLIIARQHGVIKSTPVTTSEAESPTSPIVDDSILTKPTINDSGDPNPLPSDQPDFEDIDDVEDTVIGEINRRKEELKLLREKNPELYLPFFDTLLENGYFYLYDHLIEMNSLRTRNDREQKIRNSVSFSDVAHVIMEAKDIISEMVIDKVGSLQANKVVFLLGVTGSGKSTFYCHLRGDEVVQDNHYRYDVVSDEKHLIGHSSNSCTLLPNVAVNNGVAIIDFPGFDDTRGNLISLGLELAFKDLLKRLSASVVILHAPSEEGRYLSASKCGAELTRLFDNKLSCLLALTHYSSNFAYRELQNIKARRERLIKADEAEDPQESVAVNILKEQLKNEALTLEEKKAIKKGIRKQKMQLLEKETKNKERDRELAELNQKESLFKQKLEEMEQNSLTRMGMKSASVVRLETFEMEKRAERLEILQQLQEVKPSPLAILKAEDKSLLNEILDKRFKDLIALSNNLHKHTNFEDFLKSVREQGFLNTLLESSFPVVIKLLSDVDPTIRSEFEKKVLEESFNRLMKSAIDVLNPAYLKTVEEMKKNDPMALELWKQIKGIQEFILRIKGIGFEGTSEGIQEKWKEMNRSACSNFVVPLWLQSMLSNDSQKLGALQGLDSFQSRLGKEKLQSAIDTLSLVKKALRHLNELKKLGQQGALI